MLAPTIEAWNHSINTWFASLGAPVEGLSRLLLAACFGALVGLEREVRGRQAGFRTYLLVCLGSALTMLVSVQFAFHPWIAQSRNEGININIDPARLAYGVMTGIGFLGAGVIVQNKGQVRGLTTAAGLWCVAALGLAVGFGMYLLSVLVTVLILAALWILDYVEDALPKVRYRTVTVRTKYRAGCVADVVNFCKRSGLDVVDAIFDRSDDLVWADVHLHVAFYTMDEFRNVERQFESDPSYQLMATEEV
jgi:putative Mg2+ transporter-C (MgtC) family protein